MLRNLGVSDVVGVGVWMKMAVEHTVRDAADLGYHLAIVPEATSSINDEWHQAALGYALTNIAAITDTAAVSMALESAAAIEESGSRPIGTQLGVDRQRGRAS